MTRAQRQRAERKGAEIMRDHVAALLELGAAFGVGCDEICRALRRGETAAEFYNRIAKAQDPPRARESNAHGT